MAEALVSTILEQLASIKDGGQRVGVDEEKLQKLTANFQDIQGVLRDAETRQVKEKDVENWLDRLKDKSYGIEDLLDEWNTKIRKNGEGIISKPQRKVCSPIPHDIVSKFNHLSRTLDDIAKEKDKYGFSLTESEDLKQQMTTSSIDLPEVKSYGRDQEKKKLLNLLLDESHRGPIFPIISIVGVSGSGKTTLAQQIFNTKEVKVHFEKRLWVRVTGLLDEISIAKLILKCLNVTTSNLKKFQILGLIQKSIEEIKILIVLDDVCITNPKIWKELMNFLKYSYRGSRILATIRKQYITKKIGTTSLISLEKLSSEDCWSLFCEVALLPRSHSEDCEKLKEIGKEIVRKCNGLPLTLRILGGLLRLKTTAGEWERVLASKLWKLEDIERRVFSSVLLSYYDLPINLRKCFAYCAIFPKGYRLEKDKLMKLWMVQGYLNVEGRDVDVEKVGEEYFNILAVHFFNDFERSEHNNNIISCKMPDVVHDFAQFLTKNEYCIMEADGPKDFQFKYEKVQHLKIIENSFSSFVSKKLRLFSLVKCVFKIGVNSNSFEQLTCLRTLDLSNCSIEEVPRRIKSLIHLRYLNLSHNNHIKKLPETLCDLYNLQMLDISSCQHLQGLPRGIEKLINLLHLINHGTPLRYVPKGFEKLTSLRTLNKFAVCDEKYDKRACKVEILANMNHLRGFLIITGLGNVSDSDEVNQAKLGDKNSLVGLGLRFDGLTHVDDEEIFKRLKPPPYLEELMVQHYIGQTMSLDPLMSLKELRVLKLSFCLEFEHLPPVGQLPFLVSLYVSNMKNVKSVGEECFFKKDAIGTEAVFPKLRILEFKYMDVWKEWKNITNLSCLQSLTVGHCQKLEALPAKILETTELKKLKIENCSKLNELYKAKTGEGWSKISHIRNIKIDGQYLQRHDY